MVAKWFVLNCIGAVFGPRRLGVISNNIKINLLLFGYD